MKGFIDSRQSSTKSPATQRNTAHSVQQCRIPQTAVIISARYVEQIYIINQLYIMRL